MQKIYWDSSEKLRLLTAGWTDALVDGQRDPNSKDVLQCKGPKRKTFYIKTSWQFSKLENEKLTNAPPKYIK